MKLWKEYVIFATDNHILILTYGSSNCLQLGKNYSFFFYYYMEIRWIRWKAINTTAWKTYTNVQWCEQSPWICFSCGPFYYFSSKIFNRSVLIKMLVEKFSRDTVDHRIVEVGKVSSRNNSYWIRLDGEVGNLFSSLGFSESQTSTKISVRSRSCPVVEQEEWTLNGKYSKRVVYP